MARLRYGAFAGLGLGAVILAALSGCDSGEIGGAELPNAMPDTRISGEHPSLMEAGFVIRCFWDGVDPDGKIAGYQWKLSNNGTDGISVHDTVTIDPATGATINPWRFTARNDTVLFVSADLPGYPPDAELDPRYQRSFQTHTLFVRAMDREGGVDPTPALLSFTSTTMVPWIRVNHPPHLMSYRDVQAVTPTMRFSYYGRDPDAENGRPTQVRYLLKTAWHEDHYVRTKVEYDSRVDQLISYGDSAWSDWQPYAEIIDDRIITVENMESHDLDNNLIIYFFALQAQDTAGAVSVDRIYARDVQNVYISNTKVPVLYSQERYLGRGNGSGLNNTTRYEIAPGQELNFNWTATADYYSGLIEAYRYGWDVIDPEDPDDPNWAIGQGNSVQHRRSPTRSFSSGAESHLDDSRLGQLGSVDPFRLDSGSGAGAGTGFPGSGAAG